MQQEIRHKSCKTEPCETAGKGISPAHRCEESHSVQSCNNSKKKHPESQDACSKKCSGTCTEADRSGEDYKFSITSGPLIFLINIYRRVISPLFPPCCRFQPTCSSYAISALRIHGFFKGSLLTIWRILRCQPLSKGGYDPVPPKGAWRPKNSD